jgi:hypothetical protein
MVILKWDHLHLLPLLDRVGNLVGMNGLQSLILKLLLNKLNFEMKEELLKWALCSKYLLIVLEHKKAKKGEGLLLLLSSVKNDSPDNTLD